MVRLGIFQKLVLKISSLNSIEAPHEEEVLLQGRLEEKPIATNFRLDEHFHFNENHRKRTAPRPYFTCLKKT